MLKKTLLTFTLMSLIPTAFAAEKHTVIAPNCFIPSLPNVEVLSTNKSLSVLKLDASELQTLIRLKNDKNNKCGGFIDVTASAASHAPKTLLTKYSDDDTRATRAAPRYKIKYKTTVEPLLKTINPQNMITDLTKLTSFADRYANDEQGNKAALWIADQLMTMANENHREDVGVSLVKTEDYSQPSVVMKLGDVKSKAPGIVIGAHIDTISYYENDEGLKPGADDDGSGTVTNLEIARTILASGIQFKRPLYFIWYAAEEEGLVGSQAVVNWFKKNNVPVVAAMQLDMTGYARNGDLTMWLMDDYTNKPLRTFLETLMQTYVKQPIKHSRCGYACSDHASWHLAGVPAVIPFEAQMEKYNPYIHSTNDTMDHLNFDHMTNFVKTGVAFAVELAEPQA